MGVVALQKRGDCVDCDALRIVRGCTMLARVICFIVVASAFMSGAYPQGAAPPGGGSSRQNQPPTQPATFETGGSRPNAAQPAEAAQVNPDPARQRVDREFDHTRDSFVAPTVNIGIEGAGIALPPCVAESQEGKTCK